MASRNHSRAASAGRVRRWPGRDGVQRRLLRRSGGDAQCVRDAAGNADVLVEQLMVVVHGTVGVLAELGQAPLEFSCLDAVESFYGLCRGTRSLFVVCIGELEVHDAIADMFVCSYQ